MGVSQDLKTGFDNLISRAGTQVGIQHFNAVHDEVYDDADILQISGNMVWTSGIVLPVNSEVNSADGVLSQQGILLHDDMKLYVVGSELLAGSDTQIKIQIGSPTGEKYMPLEPKVRAEAEGSNVYKKVYLRRLTNGSFIGE